MKPTIKLTPRDVARLINGVLVGPDSTLIDGISSITNSKEGDLTFLGRPEFARYVDECNASCIITPKDFVSIPHKDQSFVGCENPYLAMVTVLKHIADENTVERKPEIHRSAVVSPTAKIGKNCRIAARCFVGDNCIIADGCYLLPNVILYDNVIIGERTILNANVVCYPDTLIGKRCVIHAGTVIGSDGFGFVERPDSSYEKIPHLGNVVIGDDVEVGANCTIDRAMLDSTIIEDGVKLDNLIHIAHNCFIGSHTAIAAQVGISGTARVGRRNRIGGQVGIAGHLEIADDVVLAAQSGVAKTIREKGIYFGSPAKERMQAFKIEAYLRKLPDIAVDVEMLKKHIIKDKDKDKQ